MTTEEFWGIVEGAADLTAYTWGLWGAAYVVEGGCGDDSFDGFRSSLIKLGRAVFERAVADPDSLADVDLVDGDEWEDWMSPTMRVIHARTGEYDFADPGLATPRPEEPAGEEWDEDELPQLFPRLTAKYG